MIENSELYEAELRTLVEEDWIPWEKLNNSRILITGASGMIGSYLVDLLMTRNGLHESNIRIFALGRDEAKIRSRFSKWDSQNLELVCKDVLDISSEDDFIHDVDYIIHAASNTHPAEYALKPVDTIKTNVLGLMRLFDTQVYREKNSKIVVLSSVEIYGEIVKDNQVYKEDDMGYINSNSLRAGYPESKRLCETMLQAYKNEYGIHGNIVRLSRVYGPGVENDDSKALSQFIHDALNNRDIVLKSDGKQVFSYCYVADAASAIIKIMLDGTDGEAYNVISPMSDCSLKEIAENLAALSNTRVVFNVLSDVEKLGVSRSSRAVLDDSKYKLLGGRSVYTMKQGLCNTLQMMRQEV